MDESQLKECTVRLKAGTQLGTGFYVDSNAVLTCHHVVREVGLEGRVDVGEDDHGVVTLLDSVDDMALIKVVRSGRIAPLGSQFKLGDPVFSYGYPRSGPVGDPISGTVIHLDGQGLLKFKDTSVEPGMSGAPLLNLRTQRVCGMVKAQSWSRRRVRHTWRDPAEILPGAGTEAFRGVRFVEGSS